MNARAEGLARLKAGDLAAAVRLLDEAAAAAPQDMELALAQGVARQRVGDHAAALETFRRAEALRPDDAAAPLYRALSLLELGRTVEARAAAERACALGPGLAPAHIVRGRALRASGERESAQRALAEAERLSGARPALNAWRPTNKAAALGLAVEYLAKKPAFAVLPFGEWSQVLRHQAEREHYIFVIDLEQRIRGFLGWTLAQEAFAEAWAAGQGGLFNSGAEGDFVIVNAWASEDNATQNFMRGAVNKLFADRRAVYFKRHYPDGRTRPVRLVVPPHRRKVSPAAS